MNMLAKIKLKNFLIIGFASMLIIAASLTIFSSFVIARNEDADLHRELLLTLKQKLTEISAVQDNLVADIKFIKDRDSTTKTALDSIMEKMHSIEELTNEESKNNDSRCGGEKLKEKENEIAKELLKLKQQIAGEVDLDGEKKPFINHCAPGFTPKMFPSKDKLWVISFGLYGSSEKYLGGAWDNLNLAKEIYPEWTVRFYVGSDVPRETVTKLKENGAQIIEMQQVRHEYVKITDGQQIELPEGHDKGDHVSGNTAGMFWRFLPEDDETVERFIVRDSDSRVSWRERAAVYEWIATGKAVHVMRDHTGHAQSMPGGMWGSIRGAITKAAGHSLKDLILKWAGDRNQFYADMNFLNDLVWPLISHDVFSHDAFSCEHFNAVGFPTKRKDGHDFVGQVHMGSGAPPSYLLTEDVPLACRRHPEWTKG